MEYPNTLKFYIIQQFKKLCEERNTRDAELALCLNVEISTLPAFMDGTHVLKLHQLWELSTYFNVNIGYFFPQQANSFSFED